MARSSTKKPRKTSPSETQPPTQQQLKGNPNPPPIPPPIPPPFTHPPPNLSTHFLSTLPPTPTNIYLIHIDNHPRPHKRQVFLIPVWLNTILSLLLCWRLYYALPFYIDLLVSTLGYPSPTNIDTQTTPISGLLSLTISRTLILLGDYLFFAFLGSWPLRFTIGVPATRYASPLKWRWALGGFRDKEVIVRRSRREWDQDALRLEGGEESTLKRKILSAMDRVLLDAKTGYLLEDREWSLDFRAMIDAHALVGAGKLALEDLETMALVYRQQSPGGEEGEWMVWRIADQSSLKTTTTEQRDTLLRFKDKLTALGQEELFYRWVELVQFESSSPGGFTPERQAGTMREAKRLFKDQNLDFAGLWDEIGGGKEMMAGMG